MLQLKFRKQLRDFELALDLALREEVTVLLGPSGHGKTTVLNIVAGIMNPDEGHVTLSGRTLFDSASAISVCMEKREVGFLFQDYALFPHMTVADNVGYGLKAKRLSKREITRQVDEELERMDISSLRDVRPCQISGGQRQRVALARTLITRPRVMLLDEPLGALDMQLRTRVRAELRSLLSRLGVPTIVVSHDPLDAVGLGDEVVVLEHGRLVQRGSYDALLAAPRTEFVADFVETNAYRASFRCWQPCGEAIVALRDRVELLVNMSEARDDFIVSIHPWEVSLSLEPHETSMRNALTGTVIGICALRDRVRVLVDVGVPLTAEITKSAMRELDIRQGQPVIASFKSTSIKSISTH